MSKFVLSEAMGGIPDGMLQEAMEIKKSSAHKWIFRAAAVAAVLALLVTALLWPTHEESYITGPGILSITAHAADGEPYTVAAPDMVNPPEFFAQRWGNGVNWAPGWPFTLSLQGEEYASADIHFEVTVDEGAYFVGTKGGTSIYHGTSKKLPSAFSVPNHTTIFWSQWYDAATGESGFPDFAAAWTKIIVYDGEQIIGYVVMRFDRVTWAELDAEPYNGEYSFMFSLSVLASVSFPKVNGTYQEITKDYVDECIAKLIDE